MINKLYEISICEIAGNDNSRLVGAKLLMKSHADKDTKVIIKIGQGKEYTLFIDDLIKAIGDCSNKMYISSLKD